MDDLRLGEFNCEPSLPDVRKLEHTDKAQKWRQLNYYFYWSFGGYLSLKGALSRTRAGRQISSICIPSACDSTPAKTLQNSLGKHVDTFMHIGIEGLTIILERNRSREPGAAGDNQVLGYPFGAQTVEDAIADGVYVILKPMTPGLHVLNFAFDVTYYITVQPE